MRAALLLSIPVTLLYPLGSTTLLTIMTEESSKGYLACGSTPELQEQCSYSSHVNSSTVRADWLPGGLVRCNLEERPDKGPRLT
jgi:hypothetical protein